MTEEEFKAKVIGKKIGETPFFISETFSDESMPYFCVRSKDGKDFPLNLYSLCGYLKGCHNCRHFAEPYQLCCYSLGDEDYDCRGRKWEIKEK